MNHAATKYSILRGDQRQPRGLLQEIDAGVRLSQDSSIMAHDSYQGRIGVQPKGLQSGITSHRTNPMDTSLCGTVSEGRHRPQADSRQNNEHVGRRAVRTHSSVFVAISGQNDRPVSNLPRYFFTECLGQARNIHNRKAA